MRHVSMPAGFKSLGGTALLLLLLPTLGTGQTTQSTGRADLGRFFPIDLQPNANQRRVDNMLNIKDNDLAGLAAGKHVLLGIPFQVGDGVIQLGSTILANRPAKTEIKVGRKFTTLHVLHCNGWGANEGQIPIASYILHYEDGKTHAISVVNRQDIFVFWKQPGNKQNHSAKEAWHGFNGNTKAKGNSIRLYEAAWDNPRPDATVASIEFVSLMTQAAPFCVAMTVSDPLQAKVPAKPLTPAELDRLWTQLAAEGTLVYDAVETLAGAPAQAMPFLGPRLKTPIARPTVDVKKIAALIVKLDDDTFDEREAATAELQKLGQDALPQLRRTLEESKSAEVRQRVRELLEKLSVPQLTANQRRFHAVLDVFELIGSEAACKVLDEVASSKAEDWLKAEAAATLKKMQKKQKMAKN